MNLSAITSGAKKFIFKGITGIRKFSPELLLIGGFVAGGAALYFTRKGAQNEAVIVEEHLEKREEIRAKKVQGVEDGSYSSQEEREDLVKLYLETGWKFIKNYGPAFVFSTISGGCFGGSYAVLKGRNKGLIATVNALASTVALYETRTKEALGEEKAYDILHGIEKRKIEIGTEDKDGNITKKKETVTVFKDPNEYSIYAKFFDEFNPNWCKNPEQNLIFLKSVQLDCNDKLHSRGFLFLNEVYEALGLPMTQYGQQVGWIMDNGGDDYVDFGIMDGYRESVRDFVNGYEPSILLDFNVDGVIWDKIWMAG